MRPIRTLAIAGAGGQMGGLFAARCASAGVEVRPLDRAAPAKTLRRALDGADAVLLCVPVTAMDETLERLTPHMAADTVLLDVGSVKTAPLEAMLRAHPGPVVGTHPLFGPVIPEGFEPRVAIVPGRDDDAARDVDDFMRRLGFTPFSTTAEEHDRAMAFVQGLNFVTSAAYLSALRQVDGIRQFVTPSLNRRLDSAHKMLTQDDELFTTITEANPYMQEAVRHFRTHLGVAMGGDVDLLAERARWWWAAPPPE